MERTELEVINNDTVTSLKRRWFSASPLGPMTDDGLLHEDGFLLLLFSHGL